jgi:hypothetical protein
MISPQILNKAREATSYLFLKWGSPSASIDAYKHFKKIGFFSQKENRGIKKCYTQINHALR